MRKSLLSSGALYLYGDIGGSLEMGDGFSDIDVIEALAEHGPGDLVARINSGGGLAFMGMAIYSLLKSHPGKVTAVVDGVAASAASLLFMAGAVREVRTGAMLMIHDPAAMTIGPAKAHQDSAATLDKLADNYAAVYAAASGNKLDDVRAMMKATTWLTAEDAVAKGFASARLDDAAIAFAAADYRRYVNAPPQVLARHLTRSKPASREAIRARMRMRARAA